MTINIDEFRKYLEIDKSSLDDEVRHHASLLFKISEAMVEAIAKRDYFKEHLASMDAKIDQKLRFSLKKYTEGQIKSLILIDEDRVAVNAKLLEAKAAADKLSALKEAFHQRGYMIRDLVSLYVSNYYTEDSIRETGKIDDFKYRKQRQKLAENRKAAKS